MQDIWVKECRLYYFPITEDKAKELLDRGHYICINIHNMTVTGERWTVHLIIHAFMCIISDEQIEQKINKYLEYVFAITGLNQSVNISDVYYSKHWFSCNEETEKQNILS